MDDLILSAQMDALEQNLASAKGMLESILESKEKKGPDPATSGLLKTRITGRIKRLKSIREGLEKILQDASKDEKEREQALTTAWKDYAAVRRQSRGIFKECHDFLSGIAVRDRHKQPDKRIDIICCVADELLTRCAKDLDVKGHTVTIPGEEPFSPTLARIIRLRFPEWDVWNLPFAFHEFGHVVADETKDFQDFLKEQDSDEQRKSHLNELFADAFATYMLGPAYACASILLRFDPSTAYEEEEEHRASYAKRVYFILETLKKMDASLAGSGLFARGPYEDIIHKLQDAWEIALKGARPSDGLTEEDKDLLDLLFTKIYEILDFEVLVMYDDERWTIAQGLSGQLLKDKPASEKLTGREELRDVPNAAWHCRLNNPPEKAREISRQAAELCKEIIKPAEKRVPEERRTQF